MLKAGITDIVSRISDTSVHVFTVIYFILRTFHLILANKVNTTEYLILVTSVIHYRLLIPSSNISESGRVSGLAIQGL